MRSLATADLRSAKRRGSMPRNSRPNAPGIPRLVSMVGHNQGVVFHSRDDCVTFLACLEESTYEVDCALHAFALMSNRVLLLVSPCSSASLSRFIQSISRQFTLTVNRRRGRCGTLCGLGAIALHWWSRVGSFSPPIDSSIPSRTD